ncbi:MAG: sensor histidine kinase [Methanomicrobiales archaeon]|nr:sensor histidine kinase [Methanomicrobiales archaeon]
MEKHSEEMPDWEDQRMKIIGLGESSIRKSYYPELQQRLTELEQTNQDLIDAIEEIQEKEYEIRQNYEELRNIQDALNMARKKLHLLNTLTFQDIQSAMFSLNGYLTLTKELVQDEKASDYLEKSLNQLQKMERVFHVAKQYQNMGIHPPKWQNVMQVYIYAVSHLDISKYNPDIRLDGLEIFADPLLEDAFFYLLENFIQHNIHGTGYRFWYETGEGIVTLILQDDGIGILDTKKEEIFNRGNGLKEGIGLFLVREILSITEITIKETGEYQKGARFEISVPASKYRHISTGNQS